MNANTMLAETVALLETLSSRAAELAATLPSLDLSLEDLTWLAGEVEKISCQLATAEDRVAIAGPGVER